MHIQLCYSWTPDGIRFKRHNCGFSFRTDLTVSLKKLTCVTHAVTLKSGQPLACQGMLGFSKHSHKQAAHKITQKQHTPKKKDQTYGHTPRHTLPSSLVGNLKEHHSSHLP